MACAPRRAAKYQKVGGAGRRANTACRGTRKRATEREAITTIPTEPQACGGRESAPNPEAATIGAFRLPGGMLRSSLVRLTPAMPRPEAGVQRFRSKDGRAQDSASWAAKLSWRISHRRSPCGAHEVLGTAWFVFSATEACAPHNRPQPVAAIAHGCARATLRNVEVALQWHRSTLQTSWRVRQQSRPLQRTDVVGYPAGLCPSGRPKR